jgi:hypothetical protein
MVKLFRLIRAIRGMTFELRRREPFVLVVVPDQPAPTFRFEVLPPDPFRHVTRDRVLITLAILALYGLAAVFILWATPSTATDPRVYCADSRLHCDNVERPNVFCDGEKP